MKECVTFRNPLEYDDLTFRETEKDYKKLHIVMGK
jgi:predicted AAA+ superfamily ATPase